FFGERGVVDVPARRILTSTAACSEEICDLGQWNIVSNMVQRSDDREHTASGWSGSYDGPSESFFSCRPWATCPQNFSKPACN
ncbi:hypothetical protein EV363DRAFT_1173087, partial [Boletus edulis]